VSRIPYLARRGNVFHLRIDVPGGLLQLYDKLGVREEVLHFDIPVPRPVR
jgi:hypothetical protein